MTTLERIAQVIAPEIFACPGRWPLSEIEARKKAVIVIAIIKERFTGTSVELAIDNILEGKS